MTLKQFKVLLQYCYPQRILSRFYGVLANCRQTHWKNWAIKTFIRRYGVRLEDALQTDITAYANFNDFFTRQLKPELRPIVQDDGAIACPIDGVLGAFGRIEQEQMLQAKHRRFSVLELLAGDEVLSDSFQQGAYANMYLAPHDYHRVHMPFDGELQEMTYVPGRLFSVQPIAVQGIPNLFARNERVICVFQTRMGKMAVILVGAILVGSMQTHWHGLLTPCHSKHIQRWGYEGKGIYLKRGEELGYFQLGSTVIVLFERSPNHWAPGLVEEKILRYGELLASYNR